LLALAAAGCASVQQPFQAHLASQSEQVRACAHWYRALDEAIDAAGVRDAQHARVPGFPYLRVSRILASLRARASASETAMRSFATRLGQLDLESRRHEMRNLRPDGEFAALRAASAVRRTEECGQRLLDADLAQAQARAALLDQARVPDDYSLALRTIGLYPLVGIAFAAGVRRWEADTLSTFRAEPGAAQGAILVRYAPPGKPLARQAVASILRRAHEDALGMPLPDEPDLRDLAATYAPSFEIAVAGDYDRFGELRWRRAARVPQVNAAEPAVYFHAAHTRYGEQVLLQLVYTIWFSERPARGAVDLLAGKLDALVWRVTLAPDGEPVLYDSMHACGCYHMFFPTARAAARPAPRLLEEWALVPQTLPRVRDGERPLLRLASGTHYLEGVSLVRGPDSIVRYQMRDYDELRSLNDFAGGTRSVFGPDGTIAGSERAERFVFWPMGIESAGAMRQWGRHATAFVGRRHFDDADLIERRFALELGKEAR
jgi:hypothetical protein